MIVRGDGVDVGLSLILWDHSGWLSVAFAAFSFIFIFFLFFFFLCFLIGFFTNQLLSS